MWALKLNYVGVSISLNHFDTASIEALEDGDTVTANRGKYHGLPLLQKSVELNSKKRFVMGLFDIAAATGIEPIIVFDLMDICKLPKVEAHLGWSASTIPFSSLASI